MLLKPYFRQILALGSEVMDTNILVMNPSLKSHHMFEWNKHMNYYYDKYIHEHDIDDPVEEDEENEEKLVIKSLNTGVKVASPLSGEMVELSQVNDATFASGIIGKGTAIIPTKGQIIAPFDGVVDAFFDTGHAIVLKSNEGIEMLIHVGIDTVNLGGKYFNPKKSQGDKIKAGDIILEFDIQGIISEGYEVVTPVIITNSDSYMDIIVENKSIVNEKEYIMTVL